MGWITKISRNTGRAGLLVLLVSFTMQCGAGNGGSAPDGSPVHWTVPWPDPARPVQGYPELGGVEHFEIYRASRQTGVFSHHAQIARHRGTFFTAWSNHRDGEDGPGQRVLCSVSEDGRRWKEPFECLPPFGEIRSPGQGGRVLTANGLVVVDGAVHVVAEVDDKPGDVWPEDASQLEKEPYLGRIGYGRVARAIQPTGEMGPIFWLVDDPPKPIDGAPEYPPATDPRLMRLAKAINDHLAEPLHMPAWDFRYRTAWTFGADGHLLCEPSVYRRTDGVLVKLSRDRNRKDRSFRLYAAISRDAGETWQTAVRTNIPDSPSKSTSGSLAGGGVFLIGNQVAETRRGRRRDPLVIATSPDGKVFDWAAAIRHDAPEVRVPGKAKVPGFQYPSAVVAGEAVWVVYSIGKEDVAVSRVPLSELAAGEQADEHRQSESQ